MSLKITIHCLTPMLILRIVTLIFFRLFKTCKTRQSVWKHKILSGLKFFLSLDSQPDTRPQLKCHNETITDKISLNYRSGSLESHSMPAAALCAWCGDSMTRAIPPNSAHYVASLASALASSLDCGDPHLSSWCLTRSLSCEISKVQLVFRQNCCGYLYSSPATLIPPKFSRGALFTFPQLGK